MECRFANTARLLYQTVSRSGCIRRGLILPKPDHYPDRRAGSYLVEALVAVLMVSLVTATLAQGYTQISSFTVHSQSELDAIAIGQECIDQLRAQQFSFLAQNLGTHDVPIVGATPTGDAVFPRPLLRDSSLTYYNNAGTQTSDINNYMHSSNNQAVVVLAQAAATGANPSPTITATVTVTWNDGTGKHTYTVQTILASSGING